MAKSTSKKTKRVTKSRRTARTRSTSTRRMTESKLRAASKSKGKVGTIKIRLFKKVDKVVEASKRWARVDNETGIITNYASLPKWFHDFDNHYRIKCVDEFEAELFGMSYKGYIPSCFGGEFGDYFNWKLGPVMANGQRRILNWKSCSTKKLRLDLELDD